MKTPSFGRLFADFLSVQREGAVVASRPCTLMVDDLTAPKPTVDVSPNLNPVDDTASVADYHRSVISRASKNKSSVVLERNNMLCGPSCINKVTQILKFPRKFPILLLLCTNQ